MLVYEEATLPSRTGEEIAGSRARGARVSVGKRAVLAVAALVAALVAGATGIASAAAPQGDLDGWRQVFTEDFDRAVPEGQFPGAVYRSKWEVYADGNLDTTKRGIQMPSRVLSVRDGSLYWRFRDHTNGMPMLASALPKLVGNSAYNGLTYGRYAVRFRSTELAKGYSVVFLLWPDSGRWPAEGEIDFPGVELTEQSGIGYTFIPAQRTVERISAQSSKRVNEWHTAVTEWTPGLVRYLLDGEEIGRSTSRVPSTSMHWVLQTDTTEHDEPPAPGATANLEVDWVAAWSYAPGTPATPAPALPGPTAGTELTPGTGGTGGSGAANALCLSGAVRASGTRANPCRALRVRAGACSVRRRATVGRTLTLAYPAGARRGVAAIAGRRVARNGSLDLRRHVGRTVRLNVAFDRGAKRVRGCTYLRVVG